MPLPMPRMATGSPAFTAPASAARARVIGAAALPVLATAMHYSMTAPGISFGLLVALTGSEMMRLVLVTANVAVCTV